MTLSFPRQAIASMCFGFRHRHLVKFMSLVLPNGYVLDTIGPFLGTMNDASIAKTITNTCDELTDWCEEGDVMIVDRGFRDVMNVFHGLGYEVKMPEFLTKGKKQHDTEAADKSRLITKIRWRVESYHARLKKWTLIGSRIENAFIPKVADCIRILSAALNCYRGPIGEDQINLSDTLLAQQMRSLLGRNNLLQERVLLGTLSSRSKWKSIDEDIFDFPPLSLEQLRELLFGSYQIKVARSYVEEHMDTQGAYLIQVDHSEPHILRANIQSRHSNARTYKVWIQYSFSQEPIEAWYCQCTAGARNLGSCGHIASILWYLSYARYEDFSPSSGRQRLIRALTTNDNHHISSSSSTDTGDEQFD